MGLGSRIRGPGSGINLLRILDPGVKKAPIPDPQHWLILWVVGASQPGRGHALSLPPPGIEPGSPASQAGTLPKELSRQLIPVLRIRDVNPRSRFLIFSHPDPGAKTATKERGEKRLVVITFYVATNFTKLQIISVLNCWRKKFLPIVKEL